jgi:hypothetical protein
MVDPSCRTSQAAQAATTTPELIHQNPLHRQPAMSLHRQGNAVVLEVPRHQFLAARSRWSSYGVLVGLGCAAVAAVALYALAPVGIFVLQAVFNQNTDGLERLMYQMVPDAASFLLLLYFGVALVYIGDGVMHRRSRPPCR